MINLSELSSLNIILIWLSISSLSLLVVSLIALKKQTKNIQKLKDHENQRWLDLELKAQKDYQEILETAIDKAKNIIAEATKINEDYSRALQDSLSELVEEQKQILQEKSNSMDIEYKSSIDLINKKNIELLINMYKSVEDYSKSNFEIYKTIIEKQTFEAEKIAQERIKAKYEELENEIQNQKEQMIKKLNDDIYKILFTVSKMAIGKSLDFTDHEELIIKALEDAKKEGID